MDCVSFPLKTIGNPFIPLSLFLLYLTALLVRIYLGVSGITIQVKIKFPIGSYLFTKSGNIKLTNFK